MATKRQRETREVRYADTRDRIDTHEQGFVPKTYKAPSGVEIFRFRDVGTFTIDIVPYVCVKTQSVLAGNPYVKDASKGAFYWERTFFDHQDVGIDRDRYCCLRKIWGEPCPVCDELARRSQDPKLPKEVKNALREKERQLFYFLVHGKDEVRKGVQLFETAHHKQFGELLEKKLSAARKKEDHPYLNFFYLGAGGMSLEITVEKEPYSTARGSGTYNKPTNIEFVKRDDPDLVTVELVEGLTPLDDLLVKVPYKKLNAIFLQTPAPVTAEDNGKAMATKQKPAPDEDEDEEEQEEEEEYEEEEEDDDDSEGEQEEEAGDEGEGEDEETEEDDEEDGGEDEVEEEEEEPEPPKKKPVKSSTKSPPPPAPKAAPFKVGARVKHPEWGACDVKHVSHDGLTCRLEDKEGELRVGVPTGECKLLKPKV